MELNWSTFVLEIINFLVLVWILKRFLYKPVLAVIEQRRAGIEERLAQAQRIQKEANALKADYESRLDDWDRERQQARDNLAQELYKERADQIAALQSTIAKEQEKANVAEARRRDAATSKIEQQAIQQGARFATILLSQAAGPELELRLLDLLLDGLSDLSSEQIAALKTQWGDPPNAILVASVYPLCEDRRQALELALTRLVGHNIAVNYEQQSELLAGLRITIGAWVLHANVKDELKGFTEMTQIAR